MIIVELVIDGLTIRGVVVMDLDVDVIDISDVDMMISDQKNHWVKLSRERIGK